MSIPIQALSPRAARGLAGFSHALHYVIVPPGTLDRYYEVADGVHMAQPAPQKLFGDFVYEGALSVRVDRKPLV